MEVILSGVKLPDDICLSHSDFVTGCLSTGCRHGNESCSSRSQHRTKIWFTPIRSGILLIFPRSLKIFFQSKKSISISIRCDNSTAQSALRLWRGQNHKVQNNNVDHRGADINSIHYLPRSVPGLVKKGAMMTS